MRRVAALTLTLATVACASPVAEQIMGRNLPTMTPLSTPSGELQLVSSTARFIGGERAVLEVVGELRNTAPEVKKRVRVTAILYTADGRVIATSYAFSTPEDVPPGALGTFGVTFLVPPPDVASYRLHFEAAK